MSRGESFGRKKKYKKILVRYKCSLSKIVIRYNLNHNNSKMKYVFREQANKQNTIASLMSTP